MSIEAEDFARVDALLDQSSVDRHMRRVRHLEEGNLIRHWLPKWQHERVLPDFCPRPKRSASVTSVEASLRRACYTEACRRVQRAAMRDASISKARHTGDTTEREVEGWLPTA